VNENQIDARLNSLQNWRRKGNEIVKTFEFRDFVHAMGFVNAVALSAEKANHHPDIDIRWNKVTLSLSTHSAGGLTERDFELARTIDEL
jgi:4a-hydroxytetrahydrobiopterin dehydratase